MDYKTEITNALKKQNPLDALKQLAIKMHKKGKGKQEIYSIFYSFYLGGTKEDRQTISYRQIYDILEILCTWCNRKNFDS